MPGAVRRPLTDDERAALTRQTARYRRAREAYERERVALHAIIGEAMRDQAAPSQIETITGFKSSQLYGIRDAPQG